MKLRLARRLFLLLALVLSSSACGDGCQDDPEDIPLEDLDEGQDAPDEDMGAEEPDEGEGAADIAPVDMEPSDMGEPPVDFGPPDIPPTPDTFSVQAVVPPSGPVAGGTLVRIRGGQLFEGTSIFFEGVEVPVEPAGEGLIGRTPAAISPGPVNVKAVAPDGSIVSLPDGFTYTTGLHVDSIFPARVPTSGGIELTITGRGFGAQTAVSIDGRSALRVDVLDEQTLRVIAPAGVRGPADVRVTTPEGVVLSEDSVTYYEALSLRDVSPASGLVAGGTRVTLTAPGVDSSTTVRFNDRLADILSVDAARDTIVVASPPGAAGAATISVQNDDDAAQLDDGFLYRSDGSPALLGVRPDVGQESGGARVRVTGFGLDAAGSELRFGGQAARLEMVRETVAEVTVPAGSGSVDVSLVQGGVEVDRLSDAYRYVPDLSLASLSPGIVDADGGVEVVLLGAGLQGVTSVLVGGLSAEVVQSSETSITIIAPRHSAGVVDVVVMRDGLSATLEGAFTYTEPLEVWGFDPTRGAIAGGTLVRVRGRGFAGRLAVGVNGVASSKVRKQDQNNLTFTTPPNPPGEAFVQVRADAVTVTAPYPFLYFNPAAQFGGASGEDVQGAVNVSVFALGGGPIEDAFVMLSTRAATRYQGRTNALGQVTLSGQEVLGAQTVTATAAGFSTTTVQAVDAENITILLTQLDPTPNPGGGGGDPPPFGTIRGDIVTPVKSADASDARSFDMAIVRTTQLSRFGGNPDPGDGSVVLGDGRYEITTRIGDLAVVALCGVFDDRTDTFVASFMAVERFVVVADQGEYEVDLECDIPLDQEMRVKLVNPIFTPQGPNDNRALVFWDFGFEGLFPSPSVGRGLDQVLTIPRQPDFPEQLADVTFTVFAGSYTNDSSPYTETSVRNVTDITGVLATPPLLDVPEPVRPLPGGTVVDGEIRWEQTGPYLPDMTLVTLQDENFITVFTAVVPGAQTSVRLPEFPDFSALPEDKRPEPYTTEQLFLSISSVRIPGFDYDAWTYEDFSPDRWEALSTSRWSLRLK
ncbi:MAG: IPT/TIG domain-containing protein [Myxococcota bacterium]